MSVLKKTLVAAAALAFVSAPVAASAASAKKLTVSSARVAAPVKSAKSGEAMGSSLVLPLLGLVAVVLGVVAASSGNGSPSSP
jgi:hypothetical protein